MQLTAASCTTGRPALFLYSIAISLAIVLIMCPTPSDAVMCYQCNSHSNESCLASPKEDYKKPCASNYKGCRKWHFSYDLKGKGDVKERVVRECGESVSGNSCEAGFGASGKRFKRVICECNADGCNTAVTTRSNLCASKVMALIITWAFFFRGYF